jgi:hypothetical protein
MLPFDLLFHREGSVAAISCDELPSLTISLIESFSRTASSEDASGVCTDLIFF